MEIVWLFMNGDNELCSIIQVNYAAKSVKVQNYTEDLLLRAFGINENPTWEDYECFLGERVIPPTRDKMKRTLQEIGIDFYDELCIIEKTQGRMAEDHQWLIRMKGKFYE